MKKKERKILEEKYQESVFSSLDANLSEEERTKFKTRSSYIKAVLDENKSCFKVSPDTLAIILVNLVEIILILNFEKLDIISTKAIGLVVKPRV